MQQLTAVQWAMFVVPFMHKSLQRLIFFQKSALIYKWQENSQLKFIYTVCHKKIRVILRSNSNMHGWIVIIFARSVS